MTAPFSSNLSISILSAIRFLYSFIDITSYKRKSSIFNVCQSFFGVLADILSAFWRIFFRRFGGLFSASMYHFTTFPTIFKSFLQLFQPFLGHFCNFSNLEAKNVYQSRKVDTKKTVPPEVCTQARNCFLSFFIYTIIRFIYIYTSTSQKPSSVAK